LPQVCKISNRRSRQFFDRRQQALGLIGYRSPLLLRQLLQALPGHRAG
jgi:hypothetical protein